MVEAEPKIPQLLKLDFEPKVSATIQKYFHHTITHIINSHLVPAAEQQADVILQQYNHARAYLEPTLEQEAEGKIATNRRWQSAVEQKIAADNLDSGINSCLQAMQLYDHLLPGLGTLPAPGDSDFISVSPQAEAFNFSPVGNGVSDSNGIADAVEVE